MLDNLIATDNPGGLDPARRFDWAADLELPLIADVGKADVLFWISDGAFDQRSQRILRAFVAVMRAANVDFAVLGNDECDSGDVARRLGDDATFQRLARHNIEVLGRYEFNRIVTTDPHAFHVLANEYGDFGGHYRVQHHSMFINELMEQGQLNLQPKALGRVTYHDPVTWAGITASTNPALGAEHLGHRSAGNDALRLPVAVLWRRRWGTDYRHSR